MSSATSSSALSTAPSISASDPRRLGESGIVGLLLGGAAGVGLLAQLLLPAGRAAFAALALGGGLSLVAVGLSLRRLGRALGGLRLAGATLLTLAGVAAVGTFVLQGKTPQLYSERYGRLASLVQSLGLGDLFHSLWFAGLLAVLIAGLLLSMMLRWPVSARNAGFFSCHVGLLVVLLGAALSSLLAAKGRVDLHAGGAAAGSVALVQDGQPSGRSEPLGFSLRLDGFEVQRYGAEHRVALYRPNGAGGYELKASFEPEVGERHRLPGGAAFRIKAYYPDLRVSERAEPDPSGEGPGLELSLGGATRWLLGEGARTQSEDGQIAVLLSTRLPSAPPKRARHTLAVAGGAPRAVELGQALPMPGGLTVKALRFFPHFSYDLDSHAALNLDDAPANPALEVEIGRQGSPTARRWLFARLPDFNHGSDGLPDLSYGFEEGLSAPTTLLVGAAERRVLVIGPEGEHSLDYTAGLDLAGGRVRLGALYPQARRVRELSTASHNALNPAVLVDVEGRAAASDLLLAARDRAAFDLPTGEVLTFERREEEVKAYRSELTIDPDGAARKATLVVNEPLRVQGWTLYQVNFDPKDPTYSGLEAVRDPGVAWVFAGFALIALGVAYAFTIEPRRRRREV